MRRHQTQAGLVADHQRRLRPIRPASGQQQCVSAAAGCQRGHGLEVAIQRLGGLLRTARRADQNARRMRQPLVQPVGHAVGLALALGGQRAVHVVLPFGQLESFGMTPQNQVHEMTFRLR